MPRKKLVKPGDLSGRWSLGRDGSLSLARRGVSERISARGQVIEAGPASVTAAIEHAQEDGRPVHRTVRLSGRWQADDANRLVFTLDRSNAGTGRLVFGASWTVGRRHEIAWRAPATRRGRGTLSLNGSWSLAPDRRLVFTLDNGDRLRFRGALQSASVRAKEGEIRWQLGAEASGRRSRTLTFFGKWRVSRDLALDFEIESGGRRRGVMKFGAVYFRSGGTLRAALNTAGGRPLGVELECGKDLPGGGEAFARISRDARETILEAGATLRW